MFSPLSVFLSICLFVNGISKKTTDQTVMKFYGTVGHYSGTERLYFGGNPDPNPGIPEGIFPLRLFRQQSENTQASGLQIEERLSPLAALSALHVFVF